ncbi:ribokinase [Clostridia bacterium]|nr:ribokinase [Clostridia bacterium]
MKVLNFGSMNIDSVYAVDHIVNGGETIASSALDLFPGGKGLNQSVALARAGVETFHAGAVGPDGQMLIDVLNESGVSTQFVKESEIRSGNAIIQLAANGENSIILFAGANRTLTRSYIDEVIDAFDEGDILLLQNEINEISYLIEAGYKKGLRVAFNPSPFDENIPACDLQKVSVFFVNEIEGAQLTGVADSENICRKLAEMFPVATIVLTLGSDGAMLASNGRVFRHGVYDVDVVDSTAAGDTFTGYFMAAILGGASESEALEQASKASALAIGKKGASTSIPYKDQVRDARLP